LGPRADDARLQATAAELYDFMKRVRSGARVSNDDIKRFAKLFNDEITLDSVDRCATSRVEPLPASGA
jgi:LETM1 and EF-hand domain-containing protein 1